MIVDDNEDLLHVCKVFLIKRGFAVRVAKSCYEGWSLLKSFKPNVVFLDIGVGDEDGRNMCWNIKSSTEYRHITIVFISAHIDEIHNYQEYGADLFIPKPFVRATLLEAIAKLANGQKSSI